MYKSYDASHAPKSLSRVVSSELTKDMAFCIAFENGELKDVGPLKHNTIGVDFTGGAAPYASPELNKISMRYTASNDHFELDTNGQGLLANLADSSLFVWVSGATAATRTTTGNISYSERSGPTPIWKFATHNVVGDARFGFIHRNDAGSLTFANSISNIEDGELHLIGFTKQGTSVNLYIDGRLDVTRVLSGNDVLTPVDPTIGWDAIENTTRGFFVDDMHMQYGWKRALSDAEVKALYNPATRWDIFRESNVIPFVPSVPGGPAIPIFHRHYQRMRKQ